MDVPAQGKECFSTGRARSTTDQSRSPPILEDYHGECTCRDPPGTSSISNNIKESLGGVREMGKIATNVFAIRAKAPPSDIIN
jgi:hypothetical protein